MLGACSGLMWRGAPWTAVPPPAGYGLLASAVDRVGALLTIGGLVAYAWLAWCARRGRPVPPVAARRFALAGLFAVGTLAAGGLGVYAVTVYRVPAALTWPPMAIGGLLTVATLGWLGRRAVRCIGWASGPVLSPASDPVPGDLR
jgi:hypothetical protein